MTRRKIARLLAALAAALTLAATTAGFSWGDGTDQTPTPAGFSDGSD